MLTRLVVTKLEQQEDSDSIQIALENIDDVIIVRSYDFSKTLSQKGPCSPNVVIRFGKRYQLSLE